MPKGKARPKAKMKPVTRRMVYVELRADGLIEVRHSGVSQFESPTLLRAAAQIVERNVMGTGQGS